MVSLCFSAIINTFALRCPVSDHEAGQPAAKTTFIRMKNNNESVRNLLIDCTFLNPGEVPSNSFVIYASRLIRGFQQYGHYRIHVLLWRETETNLDSFSEEPFDKIILDKEDIPGKYLRSYNRIRSLLPPVLEEELKRRDISTVLLPSHLFSRFHFPRPYRHYAVIHDLLFYEFQRQSRGRLSYLRWRIRDFMFLMCYQHLITISKAVHDDVRRRTGLNSQILHNSLAFDFDVPEKEVESVCGKPYILDVNSFQQRKNTEQLILAMGLLKDRIPHVLYLKGNIYEVPHRMYLERLASGLGLEDRVIFDTEYRTEGEMRYLYTHADLFVSPSLNEGFGWTPVEAAVLKTPALVSDIEVFKEVTCGRIPTFDPHSPEDLAAHIKAILDNPPSMQEREETAAFFLEEYSLKRQIERLEEILA